MHIHLRFAIGEKIKADTFLPESSAGNLQRRTFYLDRNKRCWKSFIEFLK